MLQVFMPMKDWNAIQPLFAELTAAAATGQMTFAQQSTPYTIVGCTFVYDTATDEAVDAVMTVDGNKITKQEYRFTPERNNTIPMNVYVSRGGKPQLDLSGMTATQVYKCTLWVMWGARKEAC